MHFHIKRREQSKNIHKNQCFLIDLLKAFRFWKWSNFCFSNAQRFSIRLELKIEITFFEQGYFFALKWNVKKPKQKPHQMDLEIVANSKNKPKEKTQKENNSKTLVFASNRVFYFSQRSLNRNKKKANSILLNFINQMAFFFGRIENICKKNSIFMKKVSTHDFFAQNAQIRNRKYPKQLQKPLHLN